jgi:DNA-directed RNA polymerase subunit F
MIGEKVLGKRPVTLAEVKQLLAGRKKEKDLSYEQDLALKYAKKFSKLSAAQAEKLGSELAAIEGLGPEVIVKIVDVLPERKERLQLLISKETVLNEASLQKVLSLCSKYRK